MTRPVLVVGYGNSLRGDDAAGHHVAAAVAATELADVEVQLLHQLAPELAVDLADRRLVVFVDAATDAERVTVDILHADGASAATTHHLDARGVLGLAAALGGAPTAAVTVAVPAVDLGIGKDLSPATSRAVEDAVTEVLGLCRWASSTALTVSAARSSRSPPSWVQRGSEGASPASKGSSVAGRPRQPGLFGPAPPRTSRESRAAGPRARRCRA